MPKSRHAIDPDTPMHWQVLRQLWPYLLEFKTCRIFLDTSRVRALPERMRQLHGLLLKQLVQYHRAK